MSTYPNYLNVDDEILYIFSIYIYSLYNLNLDIYLLTDSHNFLTIVTERKSGCHRYCHT